MKTYLKRLRVFLFVYFFVSIITFPVLMVRLPNFTVLATLYVAAFVLHELGILFILFLTSINIALRKKWLNILLAIGMILTSICVYPTLVIFLPITVYFVIKVNPLKK